MGGTVKALEGTSRPTDGGCPQRNSSGAQAAGNKNGPISVGIAGRVCDLKAARSGARPGSLLCSRRQPSVFGRIYEV